MFLGQDRLKGRGGGKVRAHLRSVCLRAPKAFPRSSQLEGLMISSCFETSSGISAREMLIPTRTQQGQRDEGKGGRREGKRRNELTNSSSSFKVGVVEVLGVSFDVLDGAYQEGSKVKVVVSKGDFRGKCRAQVKEGGARFPSLPSGSSIFPTNNARTKVTEPAEATSGSAKALQSVPNSLTQKNTNQTHPKPDHSSQTSPPQSSSTPSPSPRYPT